MKILFINSLLLFLSQHYRSVNGQHPNPKSFEGFDLVPSRVGYDGLLPDSSDVCGLTCRGPSQYPLGLLACLRVAFEEKGAMPRMPRVNVSDVLDQELPKVVFGPSHVMNDNEFNLREYNIARSGMKSRLPAAILFAETTADVVAAVNCARVNGYKVSPRGGGNDYESLSTLEGSVVIDMKLNCKMEDFETDRTASGEHILPGSRYIGKIKVPSGCSNAAFLAAVYKEFKDDGGMTVVGSCPAVGVVGYILNGGFGDTTPYCGTGADMVDEIEMVLYNGTTITATETENEEVFWVSKGGTGGIGVITHFWSRVVQNPSKTKKFTNFKFTTDSDAEQASDILMKWQGFYFDDPNGTRVGGEASCSTISCTFGGVFLGSIDELVDVLSNAQLLENQSIEGKAQPSMATRGYVEVCNGDNKCQEELGEKFPKFGFIAHEFDTVAEAQAVTICNSFVIPFFGGGGAGWGAFNVSSDGNTISMCTDFGIPSDSCYTETGSPYPGGLRPESCYSETFIDAFLKAAANPKGVIHRREPNNWNTFASFYDNPNSLALGINPYFPGTGGLMIPKLQRDTFRGLLSTGGWKVNHLVHGAPLKVDSNSNGYPHRKEGWLVTSPSIEWTNILLNDPAYDGDPLKLRMYGNYLPSVRIPNFETHVFGDKAEELSRIRNKYDQLGGFDSPRYVQRNRRSVSSSSVRPSKSAKKTKKGNKKMTKGNKKMTKGNKRKK